MRTRGRVPAPKPGPAPAETPRPHRGRRRAARSIVPASMIGEGEDRWLEEETPELGEDDFEDLADEDPTDEEDEPVVLESSEGEDDSPWEGDRDRKALRATWIWTGNRAAWCNPYFSDLSLAKLNPFREAVNETYRRLSEFEPFSPSVTKKRPGSNFKILEGFFANEWFRNPEKKEKGGSRLSEYATDYRYAIYLPERELYPLALLFRGKGDRPSAGTLPKNIEKTWLWWLTIEKGEIDGRIDWDRDGARLSRAYREMLQRVNEAAKLGCGLEKGPVGDLADTTLYKKRRPAWTAMLKEFAEVKK